jgi:hypothetical protein
MIRGQTGTNMDGIRGLTDASFEIDECDYLAHPAFRGYAAILNQTDLIRWNEQKVSSTRVLQWRRV